MPLIVLDSQLRRFVCAQHRVEADGHARRFGVFEAGPGCGQKLLIRPAGLADAEHIRPCLSLVIALRKALARESRFKLAHVRIGQTLAV